MSHFTVLVIGSNVEKQLEPFNEQTENPKYLTFEDQEDDFRKEYETDGTEMIKLSSGELYYPWDDRFKSGPIFDQKKSYPADSEKVFIKHKDRYSTFEEYVEDWHDHDGPDKKTGRYGSWRNPNAKWDWWTIGGRWAGYFAKKGGPHSGYTDQGIKRDIDFDRMKSEHVRERLGLYNQFHGIVRDREFITWPAMREKFGNDKIDEARVAYHAQPVVQDLNKSRDFSFADLEDYMVDEDTFIESETIQAISTFAVVHKGQWSERGNMGWWGVVTDEKDKLQWSREFNKLIESLHWNTQLTLMGSIGCRKSKLENFGLPHRLKLNVSRLRSTFR